ncbi:MAG: hypothetical protein ABFQ62_00805 [Patescibacteria group bacterium]
MPQEQESSLRNFNSVELGCIWQARSNGEISEEIASNAFKLKQAMEAGGQIYLDFLDTPGTEESLQLNQEEYDKITNIVSQASFSG